MFNRNKENLGTKVKSRQEQVAAYNLADKPVTKALLSRASQYQDEAEQDLKKMGGRTNPIAPHKTMNEFATDCAITIAYHVTTEAMKNIGRDSAVLPGTPVPRYAPLVVAYSLSVLAGIRGELKAEGVELDFGAMAANTANLFFMAHPDEERIRLAMDGIKAFQSLIMAGRDNVKQWHADLMKLLPMYILQWTTENQDLKKHDFIPLFGSMLSGLVKAAE